MRALHHYYREIRIGGVAETIIGKEERGRRVDDGNIIYWLP